MGCFTPCGALRGPSLCQPGGHWECKNGYPYSHPDRGLLAAAGEIDQVLAFLIELARLHRMAPTQSMGVGQVAPGLGNPAALN